jgi:hypothetical protein
MIEGTRSAIRRARKWLMPAIAATVLSCAFAPTAQALQTLGSGVSMGSLGQQLAISGPGKLTVQAYDIGVAGTIAPPLQGLSFSVYNATTVFGVHSGSGELSMDISGPGMYFLNLAAIPSLQSRFQMGLVSWSATFEANAAEVPLPASVWLLIAGLGWATVMQRRRAKLAWPYRNQSFTYGT